MKYALIKNLEILEILDFPEGVPSGSVIGIHKTKPFLLPVEDTIPEFDKELEDIDGPIVSILKDKVTRTWKKKDKDLQSLLNFKLLVLEKEFQFQIKFIKYMNYEWDSDDKAIQNIMGVLLSYNELEKLNINIPNKRYWTPANSIDPVLITREQLTSLYLEIINRKDKLFAIKKQKQSELKNISNFKELSNYDVLKGWNVTTN